MDHWIRSKNKMYDTILHEKEWMFNVSVHTILWSRLLFSLVSYMSS